MVNNILKKICKGIIPYGIIILYKKNKKKPVYNSKKSQHFFETEIKHLEKGLIKVKREDFHYPFYLRNDSSDIDVYKNIMDERQYDFKTAYTPKVIIDAGANIGLSTIYFANKYPEAMIVAIEPEISNYELLLKNTSFYSNVSAVQAALWDKDGEIDLYNVGSGYCGFTVSKNPEKIPRSYVVHKEGIVKTVTIESILNKYGIEKIDILKIDIEGSEREVFKKSENWIDKVTAVLAELHERKVKGCKKAFYRSTKRFNKSCESGDMIFKIRNNFIEIE